MSGARASGAGASGAAGARSSGVAWLLTAATVVPLVAALQAVVRVLAGAADASYGQTGPGLPAPVLLDRLAWAGYAVDLDAAVLTSVAGLLVLALPARRGPGAGFRLAGGALRLAVAAGVAATALAAAALVAVVVTSTAPQTALQQALLRPAPADPSAMVLVSVSAGTTGPDTAVLLVLTAAAVAATVLLVQAGRRPVPRSRATPPGSA